MQVWRGVASVFFEFEVDVSITKITCIIRMDNHWFDHCDVPVLLPGMEAAGWGDLEPSDIKSLAHELMERVKKVTPGLQEQPTTSQCIPFFPSLFSRTTGMESMTHGKSYLRLRLPTSMQQPGTNRAKVVRDYGHRLVCWWFNGPPHDSNIVVRHTCCNPKGRCLNPHHLEWSTVAVNYVDVASLRSRNDKKRKVLQFMSDNEGGRTLSQESK